MRKRAAPRFARAEACGHAAVGMGIEYLRREVSKKRNKGGQGRFGNDRPGPFLCESAQFGQRGASGQDLVERA